MKIFGREPALWINTIAAVLGIIVTLGWKSLGADDATNIVAVLTAGAGVLTALQTRPFAVSAFTGLVGAVAVLVAGYGLDVPQETVGAVQLAVVGVLTLLARGQITPTSDPAPLHAGEVSRLRS